MAFFLFFFNMKENNFVCGYFVLRDLSRLCAQSRTSEKYSSTDYNPRAFPCQMGQAPCVHQPRQQVLFIPLTEGGSRAPKVKEASLQLVSGGSLLSTPGGLPPTAVPWYCCYRHGHLRGWEGGMIGM